MSYSQMEWLPLCGGLTLLGLIISWVLWRRRGLRAGLLGVAWSLLPMAAYLTKATRMLWQIGSAIASFASGFIFSLQVWAGVALTGLAVVLFVVAGTMRRGKTRKAGAAESDGPARTAATRGCAGGEGAQLAESKAPADDDLGDVADILRRHGIR